MTDALKNCHLCCFTQPNTILEGRRENVCMSHFMIASHHPLFILLLSFPSYQFYTSAWFSLNKTILDTGKHKVLYMNLFDNAFQNV